MTFQITFFLQVVLLTALNVGQHNCLPTALVKSASPNDQDISGFIGDNLTWVYETEGSRKFMYTWSGYTSLNSSYNFRQESTGTNHVSISLPFLSGKIYLYVDKTSQLHWSGAEYGRTIFQVVPVPGSDRKFQLYYNSEPLVTPSVSEPVNFYTKSVYPSEPAAEFYVFPSTVAASYGAKIENILPTVERIRNGDYGDKSWAYRTLLTEMTKSNHHLEHEVFSVGAYIKEDLGVTNSAFLQLPIQVQLIVSGNPVTLHYRRGPAEDYPLKYDRADNHPNIFPFIFTHSNTFDTWAITNVGTESEHQLSIDSVSPYFLRDKLSGNKEFVFRFKLVAGTEGFNIFNQRNQPFVTHATVTPFTFSEFPDKAAALFFVQKLN